MTTCFPKPYLYIETPDTRAIERDYTFSVLLGEFLGLPWRRVSSDRTDIRITLRGHEGEIVLPDILLSMPEDRWQRPSSLPTQPLAVWEASAIGLPITLIDKHLPVIYGNLEAGARNQELLKTSESQTGSRARLTDNRSQITLPIDIFGSAFFMLTRYEEIVKPDRDEHDRFPAQASLAYQEGFLERPIVDEYVEVLWAVMKRLWPRIERRRRSFRIFPTHDVDSPFDPCVRSIRSLVRSMGGDVVKRRSTKLAADRMLQYVNFKRGSGKDPYDTFDWLMRQSEKAGLRSAFYFKAAQNSPFDPAYSLDHPRIRDLFQEISERGHETGFHPGYKTDTNPVVWMEEFYRLKNALPKFNGIRGGRQHYLRFSVPETWRSWAAAGLEYDASMGFAGHAGYRCGTSHPFCPFDLKRQEKLNITERPLIAMECTVLDEKYMGMRNSECAVDYMLGLKERCALFGGEFVFLWHNSRLTSNAEKEMYKAVIGIHE
ncbi:MAG: hypothetical protein AVO34_12600 [Firmicutes bacterium ML8_F2]|jgi:hypothetical protein|nr:MAG: hypothetical protein AVO34_12600 [Firmicutes bacterium ML8_F2]